MNAVKKSDQFTFSDELLSKVFEQLQRSWFYPMVSPEFQSYLKEIRPSIVAENNSLQKSLISNEFLMLIVDGQIEKRNTPFENHPEFQLKTGDTFFYTSLNHIDYVAQVDTILLEIPMDRSFGPVVTSVAPDLDILRTIKIRPNLMSIFKKFPRTELVRKICQQELDKSVQLIDVEKNKKLFLENNSIYFVDYGSISTSIRKDFKRSGELILDFDENYDLKTTPNFAAMSNSKICQYKIDDTTTSDLLLQNADKKTQLTKSQFQLDSKVAFSFDYLRIKNSSLNLNAVRNLTPLNKLIVTSTNEEYLRVSMTNIALALESSLAEKISQDQMLIAENNTPLDTQTLANMLELRGFYTRKRKFTNANMNIQKRIYLWVHCNKICLILNNLNHADSQEVIAFESNTGFFPMSKTQMVNSPLILEIEKNPFEKFQIENIKSTFDKADFYGQKFLLKALSKRKILSKNLFTFKLFQTVLVLLVPTLIYKYLNVAITAKNSQIVISLSVTLLLFLFFQAAALFLYNYYSSEFTANYKSNISGFFHKTLLGQKINNIKVGFVQTRIFLSEFAFSSMKYQKLELPIYGALLVFYIFYIGTYSLDASVALILIFLLSAGVVYALRKKGGFTELNSVQLKQDLLDYYFESIRSLSHINLLQQNHSILKRINKQARLTLVSSNEYSIGIGSIGILGNGLFKCGTLLVLYLVVLEMIHNRLGPTQLFGVSLYLSYLATPFQAFSNFMTHQNTSGLLNIPLQFLRLENPDASKKTDSFAFTESITFSKVHFRYFDKNPFALTDVNFKIRRNLTTIFVGRSGSGKSTVLKLLAHSLDHQHGRIQIDEKDSNLFDRQIVMSELNYCPQIPELFAGTILSNLLPQRRFVVDNHYSLILDVVGLYQSLSEYGFSMDSNVLVNGSNLPLKLRKQIQMARYIFDCKDLLLFDEPTAFMTDEEEIHFLNALRRLKPTATIIIFTCRVSLAKWAEKIFMLKNGRIVEEGEYYRLLNQNGELSELYRNQIGEQ
jgi:ABC-type bacteriocin/lantibiotic exporter with double-glycine peptidase domain